MIYLDYIIFIVFYHFLNIIHNIITSNEIYYDAAT